ncbi:MAG TPA: hypothetical protein VGL94_10930 [Ktedonobacteraceae bacterium]|jgi:hypothetical protein
MGNIESKGDNTPAGQEQHHISQGDQTGRLDIWRRVFVPDRLKQQRLDQRFDATYQELTTLLENHKKLRELIILSNEYKDFTQGSIPEDAKANFRQEDSESRVCGGFLQGGRKCDRIKESTKLVCT